MGNKDFFHYTICGLDYVYLANGYKFHKTPYRESVSIDNTDDLHREISRFILFKIPRIRGQELRFFRSELGFSQLKMSKLFGTTIRTYQKWEGEKTKEVNPQVDRIMRMIYFEFLGETKKFKEVADILEKIQNIYNTKLQLKETSSGWKVAS